MDKLKKAALFTNYKCFIQSLESAVSGHLMVQGVGRDKTQDTGPKQG